MVCIVFSMQHSQSLRNVVFVNMPGFIIIFNSDWKCKRLDCENSRWVIKDPIYLSENEDSHIYQYCSVQDKVVWGT